MKRFSFPLLSLLLALVLLFTGCSLVSVVETETEDVEETEPAETSGAPATTAIETTAEPEPEPTVILGTHLRNVPAIPCQVTPDTPQSDKYTVRIRQRSESLSGAKMVYMPSREGVVYPRRLPPPNDLTYAANRGELVRIANWHAFYRESGFSVTLGYKATDAEAELNYLWRHSDLLASQCALYGSLKNGVLTVELVFHPENYLAVPRYTTPATYLGVETDAPNGKDTLPGLNERGVSVWDSEQACYALANGYRISPIPGSPAETLVNRAKTILTEIVDDTMTEWQIAYRVYVWLMEHAAYDQEEHEAGKIDQADRAKLSEALSSQLISFKAEGPLLYGVGACFGFAKASVLLLGLEGINVRRVVAFSTRLPSGRCCIIANSNSIAIHSYLYLRIDGYDYIYDPTYVGESKMTVAGTDISVYRDFSIGTSFDEHRRLFVAYPEKDFFAETDQYNPGSYLYLTVLKYDGKHDLLLSSTHEAKLYYDYLLETVFTQPAEYRTVTLFYNNVSYNDWQKLYKPQLVEFLNATGVPYRYADENCAIRGFANVMVKIAFGINKP